ncbi:MAG: hypothetical protein NTX21_07790 [Alphaproteobacteria bacterium]|nr:hypothetical protein [Alphaproteobacteria bacterium]
MAKPLPSSAMASFSLPPSTGTMLTRITALPLAGEGALEDVGQDFHRNRASAAAAPPHLWTR